MALGNSNFSKNNDNNKESSRYYLPELYVPQFTSSSPDGLDPSSLSYSYVRGYLRITITPIIFENPNDKTKYKYDNDNAITIGLSPNKAAVFAKEIRYLLANQDTVNNVGVSTTSSSSSGGLIVFSTGKELGVDNKCLIIRKIDTESGDILSTYAYQFKGNPNLFGIRNFDESSKQFERVEYTNSEIDSLLLILESFYKSMCASQAYANVYYGRFEAAKLNTKVGLIMDKLGIERSPEYKKMGRSNSFFNNPNNASASTQASSVQSKYGNLLDEDYQEE